jgi:hypothetical protein
LLKEKGVIKPETRNQKPETRNQKQGTGNKEQGTRKEHRTKTRNPDLAGKPGEWRIDESDS